MNHIQYTLKNEMSGVSKLRIVKEIEKILES